MILQLGKTHWFLGLHWQAFDAKPAQKEIKSEAQLLGATRYALRMSDLAIQVGFVPNDQAGDRFPRKAYSLAAKIAHANTEPWYGIFNLGNGLYWYIAVRDGYSILPDGDVVGALEEVERVRDLHSSFNDWQFTEGTIESLEELLALTISQEDAHAIPVSRLVPVKSFGGDMKKIAPLFLAGVVILTIAGGFIFWKAAESEKKAAQERHMAHLEQAQHLAKQNLAPLSKPDPKRWLEACKAKLFSLPLSEYAWRLTTVGCEEGVALSVWKIAPGATVKLHPDGTLNTDGTEVVQSVALEFAPEISMPGPGTLPGNILQLRFIAQSLGLTLEVGNGKEAQGPVLPGANTLSPVPIAPPIASLQKTGFVLTSKFAPFNLDFAQVPGMRILKLTNSLTDDAGYKIEGMLYGF